MTRTRWRDAQARGGPAHASGGPSPHVSALRAPSEAVVLGASLVTGPGHRTQPPAPSPRVAGGGAAPGATWSALRAPARPRAPPKQRHARVLPSPGPASAPGPPPAPKSRLAPARRGPGAAGASAREFPLNPGNRQAERRAPRGRGGERRLPGTRRRPWGTCTLGAQAGGGKCGMGSMEEAQLHNTRKPGTGSSSWICIRPGSWE